MRPMHRLPSRTCWDPRFGQEEFTIGCCDRVARRTLWVPLRAVYRGGKPLGQRAA